MTRRIPEIKVRFTNRHGIRDVKAYIPEYPSEDGLHYGTAEASNRPVALRWTGEEWIEP